MIPLGRPFLIALQFLTRLPVPTGVAPEPQELGRSLLWYPLVGFLIGLCLALLAEGLADAPSLLRAALLLCAWVYVTGGMHLDGLADSADAWAGGLGDRERMLAIMKDPAAGPAGVVAVVVVLLVKLAALEALVSRGAWEPLLLVPGLARSKLPLLFLTTPYVRPRGLGSALAAHLPRRAAAPVIGLSAVAAIVVGGGAGVLLVLTGASVFLAFRAWMLRLLGGATGDTAGALVEISEVTGLLAASLYIDE